jgi:ABC-type Zn uptake system ZnuABC Zn-binding protein ZnuA
VNGFDYEHAFLPGALMSVNNPDVQKGASHYIDASHHIKPCEVPEKLDLALGDLHPLGSAHVHIDPGNGILMCKAIYEKLRDIYGERADAWKPRYEAYVKKLYAKMKELQTEAAKRSKGLKVVFYHPGWCYLTERMGWELVGYVEARAGIPPTPKDTKQLIDKMRAKGCKLIAVEACYATTVPDYVAAQVGAKVVQIPHHMKAQPKCESYEQFLETLVTRIIEAGEEAEGRKPPPAAAEPATPTAPPAKAKDAEETVR